MNKTICTADNQFQNTLVRDLVILAMLMAVQLVYFTGVIASDDLAYLNVARNGPGPTDCEYVQLLSRCTHWASMRFFLSLLDHKAWAMSIAPLLSMATAILAVGWLARRIIGANRAWLPMLLIGLVPVNVIIATVALPDVIATGLAWLGVALCAPALLNQDEKRAGLRCAAGGLLIAVGYNAKETAAILLPSLALFVLLYRTRALWAWKRTALMMAGAVVWIFVESALLWYWTGDLMAHSRAIAQAESNFGAPVVQATVSGMWEYGGQYLRWLTDPRLDYGPVGPLLLLGLLIAAVRWRESVSGLLLCLALPGLLYLSLGSSSFQHYQPVHHQARYLVPILPALALATGVAIDRLWVNRPAWRMPAALAGVAIVAASLIAPNRLAGRWYFAATYQAGQGLIVQHAAAHKGTTLYASNLSANRFRVPDNWLGGLCPTQLKALPANRQEWIAGYGGSYVLTTYLDWRPVHKQSQVGKTLYGPSGEALKQFPLVAHGEPPRDRLSAIVARLLGRPCPTSPKDAVEIRYVPMAVESSGWLANEGVSLPLRGHPG